jgi:hypothetical protein
LAPWQCANIFCAAVLGRLPNFGCIGIDFYRFQLHVSLLSMSEPVLPADLDETGQAVRAVDRGEQRQHDRTPLFDRWRGSLSTDVSAVFVHRPK